MATLARSASLDRKNPSSSPRFAAAATRSAEAEILPRHRRHLFMRTNESTPSPLARSSIPSILDSIPPRSMHQSNSPSVLDQNNAPPARYQGNAPLIVDSNMVTRTMRPSNAFPIVHPKDAPAPMFPRDAPPIIHPSNAPPKMYPTNAPLMIHPNNAPAPMYLRDAPPMIHPTNAPPMIHRSNVPAPMYPRDAPPIIHPSNAPVIIHPNNAPAMMRPRDASPMIRRNNAPAPMYPTNAPPMIHPSNAPATMYQGNVPPSMYQSHAPSSIYPGNAPQIADPNDAPPTMHLSNAVPILDPNKRSAPPTRQLSNAVPIVDPNKRSASQKTGIIPGSMESQLNDPRFSGVPLYCPYHKRNVYHTAEMCRLNPVNGPDEPLSFATVSDAYNQFDKMRATFSGSSYQTGYAKYRKLISIVYTSTTTPVEFATKWREALDDLMKEWGPSNLSYMFPFFQLITAISANPDTSAWLSTLNVDETTSTQAVVNSTIEKFVRDENARLGVRPPVTYGLHAPGMPAPVYAPYDHQGYQGGPRPVWVPRGYPESLSGAQPGMGPAPTGPSPFGMQSQFSGRGTTAGERSRWWGLRWWRLPVEGA
ncbi:hypothetical protein N7528_004363 [Penicillium herquei]|nr:hypothetical protein N7528_004363 [Penicillium herquei]